MYSVKSNNKVDRVKKIIPIGNCSTLERVSYYTRDNKQRNKSGGQHHGCAAELKSVFAWIESWRMPGKATDFGGGSSHLRC